jgi:drug/metabolite transporter (DMT)-like permease
MLAALLALAASLSWGSSNFIAGLESRRRSVWTVAAVSHVASGLSAAVLLVFAGQPSLTAGQLLWAVCAGVAGAGAVLALYRALAIGAMSVVSPIIAVQVTIPVAAGLLLGERPAAIAYVGMVLAAAGVVLVSSTGGGRGGRVPGAAILLALLTAVLYGVMLVGLDQAGSGNEYWAVFIVRVVSACVVLGYFVASGKHLEMTAKALPALATVGILLTIAAALYTAAAGIGLLSIVAVLGSLSPAVTTAFALLFLHERLGKRQWVGVAVVFAGVVLLTV